MELSKDESQYLKRLGRKVRALREEKGWTLEQTEEHGWVSRRHLQRIKSGKNVTILTVRRVAKLFNISVSDLLKDV